MSAFEALRDGPPAAAPAELYAARRRADAAVDAALRRATANGEDSVALYARLKAKPAAGAGAASASASASNGVGGASARRVGGAAAAPPSFTPHLPFLFERVLKQYTGGEHRYGMPLDKLMAALDPVCKAVIPDTHMRAALDALCEATGGLCAVIVTELNGTTFTFKSKAQGRLDAARAALEAGAKAARGVAVGR